MKKGRERLKKRSRPCMVIESYGLLNIKIVLQKLRLCDIIKT